MKNDRRRALKFAGASAFMLAGGRYACAQDVDTLRIVTGYVAGGTSDALCRRVASKLSPGYARATVVENRTGAFAQLSASFVKSQPADGKTVLQAAVPIFTLYPHIYKTLPYDPVKDFTPLTLACYFDCVMAVGPGVPASVKTLNDFVTWAKANTDKAAYGTSGAGTVPHFIGTLLAQKTGARLTHVPYRGAQSSIVDLLGGSIPAVVAPIGDILQQLSSGKIRVLASSGDKRSTFLPDVPTFKEIGFPDLVLKGYFAFFVSAKTAPSVVQKLSDAFRNVLKNKEIVDGLSTFGLEVVSTSPTEASEIMRRDREKWATIVKQAGYVAE